MENIFLGKNIWGLGSAAACPDPASPKIWVLQSSWFSPLLAADGNRTEWNINWVTRSSVRR